MPQGKQAEHVQFIYTQRLSRLGNSDKKFKDGLFQNHGLIMNESLGFNLSCRNLFLEKHFGAKVDGLVSTRGNLEMI